MCRPAMSGMKQCQRADTQVGPYESPSFLEGQFFHILQSPYYIWYIVGRGLAPAACGGVGADIIRPPGAFIFRG